MRTSCSESVFFFRRLLGGGLSMCFGCWCWVGVVVGWVLLLLGLMVVGVVVGLSRYSHLGMSKKMM
ncbi:MAG: hypothetical protein K0U52_11200 [Gammaproteobacteria bacterium]|nr:hypothetical protein [Gammaproteobacteria bacterium]